MKNKIIQVRETFKNKSTINGTLKFLKSASNRDYVGISIEDVNKYVNFIRQKIDIEFINNQQKRDNSHYHITVVNPNEFSKLSSNQKMALEKLVEDNINKNINMNTSGIGKVEDEGASSWFIICINEALDKIRENLSLPKQHYHVTLGFDKSDVFIHPKDNSALIYDINEINFSYKPKNSKN